MRRRAPLRLVLAFALGVGAASACEPGEFSDVFDDAGPEALRAQALAFASDFLGQIDAGEIPETWSRVASNVQARAGRETWEASLREARATYGAFERRTVLRYGFRDELADAPPGTYFIVEYDTVFVDGRAVERVVCFLQGGRDWRVSGYFATAKR